MLRMLNLMNDPDSLIASSRHTPEQRYTAPAYKLRSMHQWSALLLVVASLACGCLNCRHLAMAYAAAAAETGGAG